MRAGLLPVGLLGRSLLGRLLGGRPQRPLVRGLNDPLRLLLGLSLGRSLLFVLLPAHQLRRRPLLSGQLRDQTIALRRNGPDLGFRIGSHTRSLSRRLVGLARHILLSRRLVVGLLLQRRSLKPDALETLEVPVRLVCEKSVGAGLLPRLAVVCGAQAETPSCHRPGAVLVDRRRDSRQLPARGVDLLVRGVYGVLGAHRLPDRRRKPLLSGNGRRFGLGGVHLEPVRLHAYLGQTGLRVGDVRLCALLGLLRSSDVGVAPVVGASRKDDGGRKRQRNRPRRALVPLANTHVFLRFLCVRAEARLPSFSSRTLFTMITNI